MRKEFRKVLKKQFADEFDRQVGAFCEMKMRSPFGEIVYGKIVEPQKIGLFVILFPDAKRESFTIEVGWSTKGRFPELPFRPSGSATITRNEFTQSEFICRLGNLFGHDDYWWFIQPDLDPFKDDFTEFVKNSMKPISPEEAETLVKPQVEAAIGKLVKFGLPYLNEYLSTRSK